MSEYKRNIYILTAIEFFSSLFIIKVIYTLYFQFKGISLAGVGIILASYQVSKVMFELPTGLVADKYNRKISVIIGFLFFEIYLCLNFISDNLTIFIIASVIQGIGYTFISGASSALLVDSLLECEMMDKLSFIASINRIAGYSGLAIGALVGGILADKFNYNIVYLVQIIIFLIPLILMFLVKEPLIREEKSFEKVSIRNVIFFIKENRILINMILINSFIAIAFIPIDGYYSNYLIVSGIKDQYVGGIIFIQQTIAAIITVVFLKRIENHNKIIYIKILPILMVASLLISFLLNVGIISLIFYFIGQLAFIIIAPLIFEIEHKNTISKYRATVDSVFSIFLSITAIISNLIFGYFSNIYGFKSIFIILTIIAMILLLINSIYIKVKE